MQSNHCMCDNGHLYLNYSLDLDICDAPSLCEIFSMYFCITSSDKKDKEGQMHHI